MISITKDRRNFILKSVLGSGGVLLNTHLLAMGGLNSPNQLNIDGSFGYYFLHGVASFDPTASAVIIWTRFTPTEQLIGNSIPIIYEISYDKNFDVIIKKGTEKARPENDYTVIVDVKQLRSNSKYFYRFRYKGAKSVIGETITIPGQGEDLNELNIATCSCSNYPAGYFNVYDAIAKSEADIVLHLGDYIYEYGGPGSYGENKSIYRPHKPSREILRLEEYRKRYRQYRTDESLQLAHQKKPFIIVWDDHEIANDVYKNGAENHQETEGSFEERKAVAIKVHNEYLPVRSSSPNIIYRNFEFGSLINLVMLDTRVVGRDRQVSFESFFNKNVFDKSGFENSIINSKRLLLGDAQFKWMTKTITNNYATWQVLGQQVLMGKLFLPTELLIAFRKVEKGELSTNDLFTMTAELVKIKIRHLQNKLTLTKDDIERISNIAPYNLDAWDGYFSERERLFSVLRGKKVVVFAGDTHNAWHNKLYNLEGEKIGEEFGTPSVTSPGFKSYLNLDEKSLPVFEKAMQILIDGLDYLEASNRGFILTKFTPTSATTSYRFVDTISRKNYNINIGKSIAFGE